MNTELAPKYSQQVGNNVVQWFEGSNSYVVITQLIQSLLIDFLEAKNELAFVEHIQKQYHISQREANKYYSDLSEFLKDINATPASDEKSILSEIVIPQSAISKHYAFGASNFTINYSSETVLKLIDPQLQHGSVEQSANNNTVFDIFLKDKLLHFYKNQLLIGTYPINNFNFLQGKVSMELVTALYKNTEADWLATFHASTVCNDHEAIMIIGDSGNGKSTLSAVLMAHGFDLLADDFTPMLAEDQHLYRFPAAISIKEGAFPMIESLFQGFDSYELQQSTSKQSKVKYLPPSTAFQGSQKHFACHKVVMVKYDSQAKSELRDCPSETFLQTFIPESWISPQPKHAKQFLNWLKDLKLYELTYSDNEFAVAKFKELFDQ